MKELDVIKVAELRKKISAIPGKLLVALLLLIGGWMLLMSGILSGTEIFLEWLGTKSGEPDLFVLWNSFLGNPLPFLSILVVLYGVVSYLYYFIRLIKNWFFGLLVAGGVVALVLTQAYKMGEKAMWIALAVMLLGGPALDIINCIRYVALKNRVIRLAEDGEQHAYGDGYDSGYGRGYDRGVSEGRRLAREEDAYYREERRIENERQRYSEIEEDRRYREDRRLEEAYHREEERLERQRRREHARASVLYEDEDDFDNRFIRENYEKDARSGYEKCNDGGTWGRQRDTRRESAGESTRESVGDGEREAGSGRIEDAHSFFHGCKDAAAIRRRYKDLCKVYHPDAGNGSEEIFRMITEEYHQLL